MKVKRDYQIEYDGLVRELQEAIEQDSPARVVEINAEIHQLLENAEEYGEEVQRA